MKTYHLSPGIAGWQLTLEGFDDPVELYKHHTQAEALDQAQETVTSSGDPATLHIHHPDGTLAEERTYPPPRITAPIAEPATPVALAG